jgi:hypothetical protein
MTDEPKIKYDKNDETSDIDGTPRWRYIVGRDAKDDAPEAERRPLVLHLTQPDEAQLLVLLRLVDLAEDDQMATVRLYADALDALMAPGESHRCQRWLLQRRIPAEEFIAIGPAVIRHYWPELIEDKVAAPKHGPTARRRTAARR